MPGTAAQRMSKFLPGLNPQRFICDNCQAVLHKKELLKCENCPYCPISLNVYLFTWYRAALDSSQDNRDQLDLQISWEVVILGHLEATILIT